MQNVVGKRLNSAGTLMSLATTAESDSLWNTIRREATTVATSEPVLAAWMHEAVVNQSSLASALAQLIAVDEFAFKIAVNGMQIQSLFTREK